MLYYLPMGTTLCAVAPDAMLLPLPFERSRARQARDDAWTNMRLVNVYNPRYATFLGAARLRSGER